MDPVFQSKIAAVEEACDRLHQDKSSRLRHLERRDAILWGDNTSSSGGKLAAIDKKLDEQGEDIKTIKRSVNKIDLKLGGLIAVVTIIMQVLMRYAPSP